MAATIQPCWQASVIASRAVRFEHSVSVMISSPTAWQALETVRCVQIQIGDRTKLCVTRGSRQAAEVLRIFRLTELDPPELTTGEKTSMW